MDLMFDFVDEHLDHVVFVFLGAPCLWDTFLRYRETKNLGIWGVAPYSHAIIFVGQLCWLQRSTCSKSCPVKRY